MRRPGKNDEMSLNRLNFCGSYFGFVRILAQFTVTPIRKISKLSTIIYLRELQRTPEQ